MTEKQELLLQLFREVDAICKKHNLRYVMAGGTLIGVLRNEGFIPWDDDVDIYMPKSDWDKFVEICKTEMPDNRAIYCSDVDRTYIAASDNAWCCMRPSGTEPKIKYYFGVKGSSLEDAEKKLAVLKEDLLK